MDYSGSELVLVAEWCDGAHSSMVTKKNHRRHADITLTTNMIFFSRGLLAVS